jgi:hypothetical protein
MNPSSSTASSEEMVALTSRITAAYLRVFRDNQDENSASIWMRKCRQRRACVRA